MSEWLEQLPEALRDAPFIGKADSVEDAVGKLAHAAQLVGTSVRIPGEDADDKTREEFYAKLQEVPGVTRLPDLDDDDSLNAVLAKLGAPEDHTGYKLPDVDNFEWDENMGEQLRKYAHDARMTPKQFTAFAKNIASQEQDANRDANQALEDARKELRLDWGDTLEEREALIRGYLEASDAPESMRDLLNDKKLPLETMNWLHQVAKQFKGEVTPISSDGKGESGAVTPAEARDRSHQLLEMMTEHGPTDPRYKDWMAENVKMMQVLDKAQSAA